MVCVRPAIVVQGHSLYLRDLRHESSAGVKVLFENFLSSMRAMFAIRWRVYFTPGIFYTKERNALTNDVICLPGITHYYIRS